MKWTLFLLLALTFCLLAPLLNAQTNTNALPAAPNASSVATAAQDFSNGFAALGIPVSAASIVKLIILLHILAKVLLKYAVKNPNNVVSQAIKFAAVDRQPIAPAVPVAQPPKTP
jgi:hypothetical protein